MVSFGLELPEGRLPVYSVSDEKEARELITLACPMNHEGQHIAPELAEEQTLENLEKFSRRLGFAHSLMVLNGGCRCKKAE